MNIQRFGDQVDRFIRAVSPGWTASREQARLQAAQAKYLAAGYNAAAQTMQRGPRLTMAMSEGGSITDLDRAAICEWSRNSFRNGLITSGFMRRAIDNIVGDEIAIQPASSDAGYNKEVTAGFKEFTRRGGGWEVTGRVSLGQYQRLVLFTAWRDGDLLQYLSDYGWQFFEGQQIGTPLGYDPKLYKIVSGIELDAQERPSRYWVADYSERGYIDYRSARGIRADRCHHIVNLEWLSARRGMPIYTACLPGMEDLERYLEAYLLGAMAAACVVGEINSPKAGAGDALNVAPLSGGKPADPSKPKPTQMRPAMIIETRTNEKFTLHSPNRPSGEFPEYVRLHLRLFGMPIGMPLELTVMDSSQANFASAKLAVSQAAKTQAFWRNDVVVGQATAPVYLDYIENHFPKTSARPDDYRLFRATEPESSWINALQEAAALNEGINGGWDTITRIATEEMRRTVDEVFTDRANEIKKAKEICVAQGLSPEEHWRDVALGFTSPAHKFVDPTQPDPTGAV